MNKFLLLLTSMVTLTICSQVYADTHVKGYTRSNGTYVQSHYRSGKDGYHNNNWSVKGNVNPHTGKPGTKDRW